MFFQVTNFVVLPRVVGAKELIIQGILYFYYETCINNNLIIFSMVVTTVCQLGSDSSGHSLIKILIPVSESSGQQPLFKLRILEMDMCLHVFWE